MKFYLNIILGNIKLGLSVGLLGGLADMTLSMRNDAIEAHQAEIINLRKLNQSLMKGHQCGL